MILRSFQCDPHLTQKYLKQDATWNTHFFYNIIFLASTSFVFFSYIKSINCEGISLTAEGGGCNCSNMSYLQHAKRRQSLNFSFSSLTFSTLKQFSIYHLGLFSVTSVRGVLNHEPPTMKLYYYIATISFPEKLWFWQGKVKIWKRYRIILCIYLTFQSYQMPMAQLEDH